MASMILGKATVTQQQARTWAASRNATHIFKELIKHYWNPKLNHGGVRPEVAYAQAAKETGFGHFGGVIDATFHNPCGLKTHSGGGNLDPEAHQRFPNWKVGVEAHLDHLALYAGARGYPRERTPDPRHFPHIFGKAGNSVEALGGAWAPSPEYGISIVRDLLTPMRNGTSKEPTSGGGNGMATDSRFANSFHQAKHFTRGRNGGVKLIVIHDMEAPEGPMTAENVANFFATTTRKASAHYNVDNNSIVQCVREADVAWHAPGANHNGIGIEHAGFARQSAAEWTDPYSTAMLKLSAQLTADIIRRHELPIRYVTVDGLKRGESGITTHNNVSLAFRKSTHTDPGPNFPIEEYITWVQQAAKALHR